MPYIGTYRLRNRVTGAWHHLEFPTIAQAQRFAATLNGWWDIHESGD